MNKEQVKDFCLRYLSATGCHIIEKAPAYVKVKLSPEADRDLTNRSYYWNFVERTGAEPETMSFTFVFDPDHHQTPDATGKQSSRAPSDGQSILERSFGFTPIIPHSGRMLEETIAFGTRRLDQMFHAAHAKGGYVQLFEEPLTAIQRGSIVSHSYTTWLGVNYKAEFICDMKREELHSLGICMSTGEIAAGFHRHLSDRTLTPRMPAHAYLKDAISLERAVNHLEAHIEHTLKQADYQWAHVARERMIEELDRIHSYYNDLIRSVEGDAKHETELQYARRKEEIEWQYRPRIEVQPINCGWFHLLTDTFLAH